jgi:hypothetical protein
MYASEDQKISLMLMDFGAKGYGLYWYITELLHREAEHKIDWHKQYFQSFISSRYHVSVEELKSFVDACIHKYELIQTDGIKIWIDRVNRNIEEMQLPVSADLSERRRMAGQKGGLAKAAKTVEKEPKTANDFFAEDNDDFLSNLPNAGKT